MKKKNLIIIAILLLLIVATILGLYLFNRYQIAHAEVVVVLKDNLKVEVYSEVKLSDFIVSLNGKLKSKDYSIDTNRLGTKTLKFKYTNDDNIDIPYSFDIEVVDSTPPIISLSKSKTITKGYDGNLASSFFCGDDYDNTPRCEIIGEYDVDTVGEYKLTYSGTDSSGNTATNDFTLYVKEPSSGESSKPTESPILRNYSDIIANYKTEETKIGIDVSKWQGNINYQEAKEGGVEFVFIRLGSMKGELGANGYFVDEKFERNIKGFHEVEIPIGIYFYSYANSIEDAKKEAKWIVNALKPYKDMIDLEVAFDWENWSRYSDFKVSFYTLTEMANVYLETLEKAGYKGMLYSSKHYLNTVWHKTKYPTWLAHYTSQTDYEGEYKYWQLCNDADVPGMNGATDVNVMYTKPKNKEK